MTETKKTALILVDVINSFFKPGLPNYYDTVVEVIPAMQALLDAARRSGAVIVHAVERHRPEPFDDFEWRKLPAHHLENADDQAFFGDFRPKLANETVVAKRRFSAFFATDLALLLTEQRVSRVIIAGVKTNVCIRATAQDAFANGFEPVIAREATNSNRPHLAAASLEDIDRYMGRVVPLREALDMLA